MTELEQALEASRKRLREQQGDGKRKPKPKQATRPTNGDRWVAFAADGKQLGDVWGEDGPEALQRALKQWPKDLHHVEPGRVSH